MHEIALFEAKNKLSGLLDRVAQGEEFLITRHGLAVARLSPVARAFDRGKAKQSARALLEAGKGLSLNGIPIKELVGAGRP
jgi:prevent-host-death family protein